MKVKKFESASPPWGGFNFEDTVINTRFYSFRRLRNEGKEGTDNFNNHFGDRMLMLELPVLLYIKGWGGGTIYVGILYSKTTGGDDTTKITNKLEKELLEAIEIRIVPICLFFGEFKKGAYRGV